MDSKAKQIPLICNGHSRAVTYIEYSKLFSASNLFYLLSASKDGTAQLRNGKTGDWIGTFAGHKGAIWSAKFSDDASKVATGSADYTAKIWDGVNGKELFSLEHKGIVKDIAFSPNNKSLATGGHEKIIRIFDIETSTVADSLPAQSTWVKNIIWNPLKPSIVAATYDSSDVVRIWDVRTKDVVKEHKLGHTSGVSSLIISNNQNFIISNTESKVSIFNSITLELFKEIAIPKEISQITCAAINIAEDNIVVGSLDQSVCVLDMDGKILERHRGHHGPVLSVAYAPDGKTFASGSDDATIRIRLIKNEPYELWQLPATKGDEKH